MKHNSWRDELLEDVLTDEGPPSARADSLGRMLAEVHRHRRQRQRVRAVAAAACLVLVIGLALRWSSLLAPSGRSIAGLMVVHTEPLIAGMLVRSEPTPIGNVNSSGTAVALVEALPEHELLERIDDDRLLALLAGRPAALIRYGAAAELIFADPTDAAGFQVH